MLFFTGGYWVTVLVMSVHSCDYFSYLWTNVNYDQFSIAAMMNTSVIEIANNVALWNCFFNQVQ